MGGWVFFLVVILRANPRPVSNYSGGAESRAWSLGESLYKELLES